MIENVEGARGYLRNPIMLCGSSFGLETSSHPDAPQGFELQRHRLFEVHGFDVAAPSCKHSGHPVVGVYGGQSETGSAHRGQLPLRLEFAPAFACQAMGVPLGSMGRPRCVPDLHRLMRA